MTEIVLYVQGITIHPLAEQAILFSLFINLVWNVMNLVPVLPLDGGHISREDAAGGADPEGPSSDRSASTSARGGPDR